jgi:hypothetical protein
MQELVETKIDGNTITITILEPRFQASNFAKFKELNVAAGQVVYIQPKRLRVFAPDYMI